MPNEVAGIKGPVRFNRGSGNVENAMGRAICNVDILSPSTGTADSRMAEVDKVGQAIADALNSAAEVEELRELLASVNTIGFEEWYGKYQDGKFWIFNSDGEGVASGETVMDAYRALKEGE